MEWSISCGALLTAVPPGGLTIGRGMLEITDKQVSRKQLHLAPAPDNKLAVVCHGRNVSLLELEPMEIGKVYHVCAGATLYVDTAKNIPLTVQCKKPATQEENLVSKSVCPVCQVDVALEQLEEHVNACLDGNGASAAPASTEKPSKRKREDVDDGQSSKRPRLDDFIALNSTEVVNGLDGTAEELHHLREALHKKAEEICCLLERRAERVEATKAVAECFSKKPASHFIAYTDEYVKSAQEEFNKRLPYTLAVNALIVQIAHSKKDPSSTSHSQWKRGEEWEHCGYARKTVVNHRVFVGESLEVIDITLTAGVDEGDCLTFNATVERADGPTSLLRDGVFDEENIVRFVNDVGLFKGGESADLLVAAKMFVYDLIWSVYQRTLADTKLLKTLYNFKNMVDEQVALFIAENYPLLC